MFSWFGNSGSYFFKETDYVAIVYYDTLRDNFAGYVPLDQHKFDAIHDEFESMGKDKSKAPWLAELFRIEVSLIDLMPDATIMARFWSIDDRFRRVVPAKIVAHYDKSVPQKGDANWANATFVRDQARTLLDVIHANYLINIGREKSVKRLKAIITLVGLLVLIVGSSWGSYVNDPWTTGMLLILGAGILGALLSIINRLQTVTSTDAMENDGIYELTGLRVGWVGILMSLALGGGFSLVLYTIVMAGLLQVATPDRTGEAAANGAMTSEPGSSKDGAVESIAKSASVSAALPTATTVRPQVTKSPADSAPKTETAPKGKSRENSDVDKNSAVPDKCKAANGCPTWADEVAIAIGLLDASAFFKMLVLAFLAGFAERFVPDILNRLRKEVQ